MTWAYIAGFFDGEGSISHNGKGYRVTIPQTSLPVLKAIQQHARVGHVIAVSKRKEHWRDAWVYYVAKQSDVESFLRSCCPYLIVKQKKTKDVLAVLPEILTRQRCRARLAAKNKLLVRRLRSRGLSWRAIGNQLGIDWGYARRLYLRTLT